MRLMLVIILMGLVMSHTQQEQTDALSLRSFAGLSRSGSNPIIPLNAGTYNSNGADVPYVREAQLIGGTWYAITQANPSTDDWRNLALYTSTDLVTWTASGSNPVLTRTVGQDDHYLLHPALIKIGATWNMYYSAMNAAGTAESIYRATADDATFTSWTKQGQVITDNVAVPIVILIGSLYHMYVAERTADTQIRLYTSADGVTWTRMGVVVAKGDWDQATTRFNDPWIYQNSDAKYELLYTAEFSSGVLQRIGYAISRDGIHWKKKADTHVLTASGTGGAFDEAYVGDPCLLEYGGTTYLFYAGINSPGLLGQGGLATL